MKTHFLVRRILLGAHETIFLAGPLSSATLPGEYMGTTQVDRALSLTHRFTDCVKTFSSTKRLSSKKVDTNSWVCQPTLSLTPRFSGMHGSLRYQGTASAVFQYREFCRRRREATGAVQLFGRPAFTSLKRGVNENSRLQRRALSFVLLLVATTFTNAATNELTAVLQKGLFEEEANRNFGAAIQAYQAVVSQFDNDRKLAATAIFRLGECYRKQGATNEATAQYERVLREFGDQSTLVGLSHQSLALFGVASAPTSVAPGDVQQELRRVQADEEQQELRRIEALLQNSPDLINAPGKNGETLLQAAAAKGRFNVVQTLLNWGADVNESRPYDLTPLHYAAGNGHKSVVDELLRRGANVDAQTGSGVTPLHIAAVKGYTQVAKALIDAGAPVNARTKGNPNWSQEDLTYHVEANQSPLDLAIANGSVDMARLLVTAKADVNSSLPLLTAAAKNEKPIVELLLDNGAKITATDSNGQTALHRAVRTGAREAVDLLLARGADVNAKDKSGETPLHIASLQSSSAMAEALLAKGADVNVQDLKGDTPLQIATANNRVEVARVLLANKANPDIKNSQGSAALHAAAGNGETEIVRLLVASKANLEVRADALGWTPLHYAVANGNRETAEVLLNAGADVNARIPNGETPLHLAAARNNKQLVELLLAAHADVNAQDNAGTTPLMRVGTPANVALPPVGHLMGQIPAGGASPPASEANITTLLLNAGALREVPRLDQIRARRSPNYSSTTFSKGTNGWNQFTLLELLAIEYRLLGGTPDSVARWPKPSETTSIQFPDFSRLAIRHPTDDLKAWKAREVNLEPAVESGNCSEDVALAWGDAVDIPESDHPLDQPWLGLSQKEYSNIATCLKRSIEIITKGKSTKVTLAPLGEPPNPQLQNSLPPAPDLNTFWIRPVLRHSGLLTTSSDLSRVKLTRVDHTTGQKRELTLDCSWTKPAPAVWLRDGDVIEVPDKL